MADWIDVTGLIEMLRTAPDDAIVLLSVGGDGAIHHGVMNHVTQDPLDQGVSIHDKKTITLSSEPEWPR